MFNTAIWLIEKSSMELILKHGTKFRIEEILLSLVLEIRVQCKLQQTALVKKKNYSLEHAFFSASKHFTIIHYVCRHENALAE